MDKLINLIVQNDGYMRLHRLIFSRLYKAVKKIGKNGKAADKIPLKGHHCHYNGLAFCIIHVIRRLS
ncbi:MAG TPA: hypothetical protein VFE53_07965 [Mucilaginibacter sp.]|jgi:hypothetical protein|nr:hypothetical protein [Mucilaginibacter sp.]